MMAPEPALTVRVAASVAGIGQAAAALDGFRAEHGLGEQAAWPLSVALDEILSNIVRHASPGPTKAAIDVTFAFLDGVVEMTISDEGPAFDPLKAPEPDLASPLEGRRPGGMGVHLVKQLMDRVAYARIGGRNRLVMAWRVRPTPRPGP